MGVVFTMIGGVIGCLFLFSAFGAKGAPQEAAAAAIAVAFVVFPYCMTSVLQRREMLEPAREKAKAQ